MPSWQPALAIGITGLLCACAVGPDYVVPDIRLPSAFALSRPSSPESGLDPAQAAKLAAWWKTLHDPELDSLVERAILANPQIEIALNRVQQAREHEIVVLGTALPRAGVGGSVAKGSGTDSVKSPRIPASMDAAINTSGYKEVLAAGGFDAGWELDLFGKYRRDLEAAQDDTEAAIEGRNAALITAVAEVARHYVIMRGLQLRLTLLRENIARAARDVELARSRYSHGVTNEGDLILAERELSALNAGVPSLNAEIFEAKSRIAVLLGTYSGDIDRELKQSRPIPLTPEQIRPGQPLDLLRRRPDIRRAERELASATARIGVAVADLLPRAGVTTALGAQGGREMAGSSVPVRGLIWSVGPSGYWPLLDFGRLDAAVNEAEFRSRELFANYRRTVISAVEEVNSALVHYRSDLERVQELAKAVDESRHALEFHAGRYEHGLTDFLNVLDAARQEYGLEEQHAIARAAAVLSYIALYKAFGGGWELYRALPAIPDPKPAFIAGMERLSEPRHRDPGKP
jgi:NodT family efflux transporter outer membrane factor (OMF) lipoprotein